MKDANGYEIVIAADGAQVTIDDGSRGGWAKAIIIVTSPKAAKALAEDLRSVLEKHLGAGST